MELKDKEPNLNIYAGAPGAGKSKLEQINKELDKNGVHINAGRISSSEMIAILKENLQGRRENVKIESVLSNADLSVIKAARDMGYRVNLNFANTNHFSEGFQRISTSRTLGGQEKVEMYEKMKTCYRNVESAVAMSREARVYNCSDKEPRITNIYENGKCAHGGQFIPAEGVKECSLKSLGENVNAKVGDLQGITNTSGVKYN